MPWSVETDPVIGVWTALVVAGAVVAIFATTASGQAWIARLGLRRFQKGAAPQEDRDYLLRVCAGDPAEVARRLDAERSRHPDWTEAQLYRRAIRTYMNTRDRDPVGDASPLAAKEVKKP